MALLAGAALMLVTASLTGWVWLLGTAQHRLELFDLETTSSLYCTGPLIDSFSSTASCVLRRTDYAAPGSDLERAPEILCLLLHRLGWRPRPSEWTEELRCG